MRIGYLYNFEAYPPRGGNHLHATELTLRFVNSGHSVSVVDDPSMPGVSNFGNTPEDLQRFINSIDVLYVRIDARFTRRWPVLKKCMGLTGHCPVVWEINSPASEGLAFSWLGRQSTDVSEKEGVIRRLRRWFHAVRQLPGIALEEAHRQRLAQGVSCAICVSTALSRYATEKLRIGNVLVLPNGGPLLSEEEIQKRSGDRQHDRFTVLYTGSAMYPWQGLNYLSQVIALAKKEAPDLIFVLAVNKLTRDLPNSDNVFILDHLNRDQILNAVCGADACVALHPEYPWSIYGFHNSPLKMFEYMACMRPVVASNHGQMREIIRDGEDGLLCENDPPDILRKLLYLRDHPERAASIGRQGWKRIQSDFNWPRNVTETLRVFGACSRK